MMAPAGRQSLSINTAAADGEGWLTVALSRALIEPSGRSKKRFGILPPRLCSFRYAGSSVKI